MFELPANFSASAIPVSHHRIIIAQYCLRMYHFHTIYPCHCHNNCRRHRRHYFHRYPHLCYRNKENQQLASNAILSTGAIEIADKIASKITVNVARVNGPLLALWRSIFFFFQIHSIPVLDFFWPFCPALASTMEWSIPNWHTFLNI